MSEVTNAGSTNAQAGITPAAPTPAVSYVTSTEDGASTAKFLGWIDRLITTVDNMTKTGGISLLAHVVKAVGRAVPAIRFNRGFGEVGALADVKSASMPVSVWYPNSTHKRGTLIDPSLTLADIKNRDPKSLPGPKVKDGRTDIFINPRLGAGLDPVAASYDVAVAVVHGLLLAVRGEPTADKQGRQRKYAGTFWTDAVKVGFSDANKQKEKFLVLKGSILDRLIRNMIDQIGPLPTGCIEASPYKVQQPTRAFKVVCPFDLADPTRRAALDSIGDKAAAALRAGATHGALRMTGLYNEIPDALPWCHRTGHPPNAMVMLDANGNRTAPGINPSSIPKTEAVTLAATGTDGPIPAVPSP